MAKPISLVQVGEPEPVRRPAAPQWKAFLSLGFRPLYIAGCAWALISMLVWVFLPTLIPTPWLGVAWHAHEMLWGFIATIAVAFLLTASATWTGFNPLHGKPLAGLCLLWIAARIAYLAGGRNGILLGAACEIAFFGLAGLALARVMLKGKSRRNYGTPLLLIGLGCVANLLYIQAVLRDDYLLLLHYFNAGMIAMAVLALLIARRIIPFFAMRAVPGLQLPMLTRSGHVQMVLGGLAFALALAGWNLPLGLALAASGGIALWQVRAWRPAAVRTKPLLWILYLGYALMAIGLIYAGAVIGGLLQGIWARPAIHAHLIGVGGFALLIIGMVTRTAMGHLGRPIALDRSMLASYYLMVAAVVLRLAALWPGPFSLGLLHTAATCWIAAFFLYLWRFTPMLIRPRADAKP